MDTIKKLMERVNNTNSKLDVRYHELLETDKKNIVFVSPFFNKQGLYRMILPALELTETKKFSTIITNILPEDHTKTIDDFSIKLVPEVIRWADYMVFQATTQDMTDLVKTIKDINPKCKIVMDVDRNYHTINPNNYAAKKFNLAKIRNFEKNFGMVDFTTYPDKLTEEFYKKKIDLNIKTAILPNLLSPYQFQGIDSTLEKPKHKDNKLRVLVMAEPDDYDDLNSFRETINHIMMHIPEAKIYTLTNSLMYENKNPLRLVTYTRVPYSDMSEYYTNIWNMNPDVAIIPIKKQIFHRNYYKILELGAMGIPMVSMNEYPYNHLLVKDQHILLSGQKKTFVSNVKALADSEELRKKLSTACKAFVQEKYSFLNQQMIGTYLATFK